MKLLRDLGFLRSLRGLLLPGRQKARLPRTITVPAPLSPAAGTPAVELPRTADLASARAAAAARAAAQRALQTRSNKVLLSRQA